MCTRGWVGELQIGEGEKKIMYTSFISMVIYLHFCSYSYNCMKIIHEQKEYRAF